MEHLLRRPFEQLAAAHAEQGVATEKHTSADVSDVAARMPGNRDNVERHARRCKIDTLAVVNASGCFADAVVDRRIDGHVVMAKQLDRTRV